MERNVLTKTGVTIERLRSFCDIVAAGSMVVAADGDPAKQSHYSRQIKDLESAIGVKLFTKTGKFLLPSNRGKQLAALTNMYFSGLQDLQEASEAERTQIRIGAAESVLRWLVFPHLPEILAVTDKTLPEFVTARTEEVIDGVRTAKFELGIIREDAVDESLVAVACGALEYTFVVPRGLLPGRSAAGIDHTKKLPLAVLAGEGQFARNSVELLKRNGVEPYVRLRAPSFSLIIEAVRSADVAAFVPKPAIQDFPQDRFAEVGLEGIERLRRKLVLICEPTASSLRPVARALGGKIAQICRSSPKPGFSSDI